MVRFDRVRELAFRVAKLEGRRFWSATDPIAKPKPEPWAVGQSFIMPSIRGRNIAGAERPRIRRREQLLQRFDLGNDLFDVHLSISIPNPHPAGRRTQAWYTRHAGRGRVLKEC